MAARGPTKKPPGGGVFNLGGIRRVSGLRAFFHVAVGAVLAMFGICFFWWVYPGGIKLPMFSGGIKVDANL